MDVIGTFQFVDSVAQHATAPELSGATYVKTIQVNGVTYVYVAGESAHGIQVLKIAANGTLTPVMSIANSTAVELHSVVGLDVVKVGNEYFLAALAYGGSAISMFRIDDDGVGTDGHLIHLDSYRNFPGTGEPTAAQGLVSNPTSIDSVKVGGNTFFVTSSYSSDALSVYKVGPTGVLTLTDSLKDVEKPGYQLDQLWAMDTHVIGDKTFVITGSYGGDDGFSVFRLTNAGNLVDVQNVTFAEQRSVRDVTALEIDGKHYVVLANSNGYDMLIYRMAPNGTMTHLSTTDMNAKYKLWGFQNVEPLTVDGVQYLLATSGANDTLAVFSIDAAGVPTLVQSITSSVELDNADDIHVQQMGSRTFVLVTAKSGNRVAVYEIGANDDPLVGTNGADRIVGQNGDDDLVGRAGKDLLLGGNGDDVLSGHRGNDILQGGNGFDVLSGGRDNDILEGGAGPDVLIGGGGVDQISYAGSAQAVTVNLATGQASGGDAAGDIFSQIEGIIGSAHADTLIGDAGRNNIRGGNGNDSVTGAGGNDILNGQGGHDTVMGGAGNDRLILGGGNDTGNGGDGNDRIDGGSKNDILIGGAGNDDLNGGGGRDRLVGGSGDDSLNGGGANDVFVFETLHGGDTIEDFNVNGDRIDLSGHSGFNNFSQVLAGSFEFMGNTVIGGGANSIQLIGVAKADLGADDFIF
ncbi:beta-propeller fold lactonase family protein [Sedimentitalea sp. HM32M-2]|uniref:beta-propeller fold lactonase family protein n=1 Tax=Sedimentitalea sp. HM32M-2 TaxID=3351566 RepID=UPI00363E55B5